MKCIIFLFLLMSSLALQAQDDPQKIVDRFFDLYKTKSPNDAIDYIFSTNEWVSESTDQIENVKFKINSTLKLLGKYEGFDLVSRKSVAGHLILYTFMVRYNRQPLRYSMLFYKASTDWKLYNFKYDDEFDDELK